ncbi:MAG: UvrD-helicase domain-containing protein [Nitrospinota bacterium]|nr:UvrD-helicase domain-containing protein [Nitrospinota bacterium]
MDDILEQIKACRTDIAVRAGAGAGKTTALVEKYMAEMVAPREEGYLGVDSIAAITFTEKAAAEMSLRVRQKLTERIEQLRRDTRPSGSSANLDLEQEEWNQDRKLLNHLIRQRQMIKSAYISTIHAFCARLLWENPLAAGVDPGFSVMDEADARDALEGVTVETILTRLRKGDPGVVRLTRDHGFRGRGRSHGLADRIMWIIPLLRAANMTPARLVELHLEGLAWLKNLDLVASQARLRALCRSFLGMSERGKEHKFGKALLEMEEPFGAAGAANGGGEDIKTAVAGRVLDLAGDLEKVVLARTTYQNGKNDYAESLEAARLATGIYGGILEAAVAEDMKVFAGLLEEVMAAYAREKESRSSLDYNDLQEKARDLLVNSKSTLDEYRHRLKRVLVDEFQDTDKLQARIINLLAPPGEGRLFLVGDMKQSIYGFRGADPGVFMEQSEEVKNYGGMEFFLVQSRRATPVLTEFFNSFFARLMAGGAGEERGRFHPKNDALVAVRDGDGIDSAVCRISVVGEGIGHARLLEADAAAAEMKRLVTERVMVGGADGKPRPARYSDMALLLRSFSNHEIHEAAMRRAGVPFQVVKGRGFYDCQEIKDLANMLFYIGHSEDRLALVSVLRSPLVGLKDETILRLFHDDEGNLAPEPLPMEPDEIPDRITGEERIRLGEFIRISTQWREVWDRVGVSELLEMILDQTGFGAVMMSRHNGERILANIFKLIELARTFEEDWARGFVNFTSRLDTMIASSPQEAKADIAAGDEEVVKMMTVHQSKGLEFPIVFLGDLGFSQPASGGAMVFSPRAGLGLKVHDLASGVWWSGPVYAAARKAEQEERTEELKRLLYVAVTRARDRLVLCGPAEGRGDWIKWVNAICAEENLETETPPTPTGEEEVSEKMMIEPRLASVILESIEPSGFSPLSAKEAQLARARQRACLRVSVTALADFARCHRMYYHQSIGDTREVSSGVAGEPRDSGVMAFGSRVHQALETAPLGKGAAPDGIARWVRMALSGEKEKTVEAAVRDILGAFAVQPLAALQSVDPNATVREAPLAMKIEGEDMDLVVHGAPDIVWYDGEKWNLVDYKYSRRPVDEGRYLFQVRLYAMILMEARGAELMDVAVVYLKEKKNQASMERVSKEDLSLIGAKTLEVAGELWRLEGTPMEMWVKREAEFCRRVECRFMGHCREKLAMS